MGYDYNRLVLNKDGTKIVKVNDGLVVPKNQDEESNENEEKE